MTPRNDNYLAQLRKRQEAAKSTEEPEPAAPEPRPELPTDPTIRSELLADELRDVRQELEHERAARQQAERRIEAQARPSSLRDLLRAKQVHKRRTWR
jgi:hypothetical protein